ncbi:unnamed protein product [Adineta steineri]|uniref:Uncharacterized protein n=2 Tax=Adineta steineri TaxID=433720 RepID=A0A813P3L1_9BILA|nr:unnamed protein product [Adineta steineri]
MASNSSIEALKGTWDYVNGDDIGDFLKEIGVGMVGRLAAKGIKPRLVITETDGIWTLRTETTLKTMTLSFTPNVEYEDTTPDGREIKGIVRFENGKWIQKTVDKNGKESMITRWIDEKDQQQIIMETKIQKINEIFQSGRHKQAITDIQTLIEESSADNEIFKAYNCLGTYLNLMGQHNEAVEAWINALKLLEDNAGGVDKFNEGQLVEWINISIVLARIMYRQGREGSGVSHKFNSVCYTASKMSESEEEEWKKERFQAAVKYYKQVIDKIPQGASETKIKIRTELAQALFTSGNFDEAVQIYEEAFNNDGDTTWLYKAADCSWQQEKKEQAYTRLQQLITTDPTFADAYQLCATYFTEKNDITQADEYTRRYKFYSWVPKFCRHIEYNEDNILLLETIQSDKALECIETTLTEDTSKRSTEFLASICYHHYHGAVENKAFQVLEQRGIASEGDEREFIGSLLMHLIKKHQSICTIKGAASALAGMKYAELFDILANLLPQDLNICFPMHIPNALGKLGDHRAIPLLIKMIVEPTDTQNDNSDSSDDFLLSGGSSRLIVECCLALSSFSDDEKVKEVLLNGINKEEIREACFAVLAVCTEEKKYFDELEKILTDGNTLDYMVIEYLQNNVNKSQQVENLLKLNDALLIKKQQKENVDTD